MVWIYWRSDGGRLWTVGVRNPDGEIVVADSDWQSQEEARWQSVVMNGGDPTKLLPYGIPMPTISNDDELPF